MDGTGAKRYPHDVIYEKMKSYIQEANKELGKKEIVSACLERFLIAGREGRRIAVDYFLLGDENYGVMVPVDALRRYIAKKKFYYSTVLHIGPMIIQPSLRDWKLISRLPPEKREFMQVKWHYLDADFKAAKKNCPARKAQNKRCPLSERQ